MLIPEKTDDVSTVEFLLRHLRHPPSTPIYSFSLKHWIPIDRSSWPHVQSIQYQQPESIDVLLSINESSQQSISFIIMGYRRKSIPIMGIRQVSWELSFAFIMKPIKSIFDAVYMKGGNGSTRAINECGFHRKICKVLNRFTRFPKKILFGLELWVALFDMPNLNRFDI